MSKEEKAVNTNDIMVCTAMCCCMYGIYMNWPGCVGCSVKRECLCLSEEMCLKLGTSPFGCGTPEGMACRLGCCCYAIGCKKPTTCCKDQEQCCCVVGQCAIPTDSEVPCAIAYLGLICYPICGCCKKVGDFPNKTQAVTPL